MVSTFLDAAISVISKLDGLDYKITDIVVKLSHPKRLKAVSG
jgi:hypothetical protein